jgi:capsular exopolysaccharide synthesis family protein
LKQALSDVSARLKALRASGQTKSALYLSLADKQQQLRTLELLQTPSKLVRPATGAAKISPTPVRNGILGLMGGILLGISVAFLLELLDRRIRSEDEIERKLRLPLLARIPPPPRSARGENGLIMLNDPKSIYAEPFRRLRTNLEFVTADMHARTILVTSSVAGEGKSTTVANLAVAAARAGRRVVVVDLDLRRPTLHESFGVSQHPGATNVALGTVQLKDALRRIRLHESGPRPPAQVNGYSGEAMLEFLPAGTLPPNPGEFLGTSGIGELLAALTERADMVFIDAAPLLAVGDTLPLGARVDGIVVVTQFGVISRPMLNDLARELQTLPTHKLGYVLTGADATGIYGYGYDYAHPTGDGAGDAPVSAARRQATTDPAR